MDPYIPKRVVDPLKLLLSRQKMDRLLMIDISMHVIILNKICVLLLDKSLGNTVSKFSKSFTIRVQNWRYSYIYSRWTKILINNLTGLHVWWLKCAIFQAGKHAELRGKPEIIIICTRKGAVKM